MRGLLVAIGFLTRIPVPRRVFDGPHARAASLAWYPLVGALIGAMLTPKTGVIVQELRPLICKPKR